MLGVDAYIAQFGADPTSLVQEPYMSDEASGPEDEDEDEDEWKQRMATESHLGEGWEDRLGALNFRELIKPEWRSEEVSSVEDHYKQQKLLPSL